MHASRPERRNFTTRWIASSRLRREAEATSRLKDEFLMTVSHELRTPLNALLGWSDMLRLGIVPEARRQRAVDAIYENAKLQTQLIADLLDTSRILTGKLRIEPAFVDLSQIVQDAAHGPRPCRSRQRTRAQDRGGSARLCLLR